MPARKSMARPMDGQTMATGAKAGASRPAGAQDRTRCAQMHVSARDGSRRRTASQFDSTAWLAQFGATPTQRAQRRGDAAAARDRAADGARSGQRAAGAGARHRSRRLLPAQVRRDRRMDRRNFLKARRVDAAGSAASGLRRANVAWAAAPAGAELSQSARADRAQGRQRRPEHGGSLRQTRRTTRLRPEARDCHATRSSH